MSIPTTTASLWPSRAAYFSAAVFIGASGATNVLYGWQKGTDLSTSLVWAGVAGAVAVVFSLSWPALIRSLEARRWSAALICLVALVLAGTYSVTAALGSAAGGRANAATTETATTNARKKAQDAYDSAKAELDALAAAKPASELQALIEATMAELAKLAPGRSAGEIEAALWAAYRDPNRYGCAFINGSLGMSCPKLDGELARARQRERLAAKIAGWTDEIGQAEQRRTEQRGRLKADMDRASNELAGIRPAKVANSDAKALARYLAAIGLNVTPDRLNDLLVLLAVVMIEAGGGLSLALGMALGAAPAGRTKTPVDAEVSKPKRPRTLLMDALVDAPATVSVQPSIASRHQRPPGVHAGDLTAWLRTKGGAAQTSMRRLAVELGRSPAGVHVEVGRLAATGVLTAAPGSRGTVLTLVAGVRPN